MQNSQLQRYCKTHPEQIADYFTVSEPWQKLCKQCALNRALCGHKIDKELSAKEFENKLTLNSLIDEIKSVIGSAEEEGKNAVIFLTKIEKSYHESAAEMIQDVDAHIKELCSIRDSIAKIYEEHIRKQIYLYSDHKNKVASQVNSLKKHLQNIQTNFCDLIEEDSEGNQGLQRQVSIIRKEVEKIQKGFIINIEAECLDEKIVDTNTLLKQKFDLYKSRVINFNFRKLQEQELKLKQKIEEKNIEEKQTNQKQKVVQRDSFYPKSAFKSRHQNNKENSIFKQYKCASQRKKSSMKEIIDESCSVTHRATNLSLRSVQRRNSSNANGSKAVRQFDESLKMSIL